MYGNGMKLFVIVEQMSFLYDFRKSVGANIHIIIYSDNCTTQNTNKYLTLMYLYAVQNLDIHCVTQKYLNFGHTKNEVPSQMATIAQVAKTTRKPYKVQQVDTTAILDWKFFYSPNSKEINVSAKKEKVIWNQVKIFEVRKNSPGIIFYKSHTRKKI
ncbi:hypothetical protein PR048_005230 [Dryococelus australis]|uniref:Uncharacterized protein n=1 Tax=Dryococelus australis TaxID=614101 RepID=A0ABQ9I7N5_9NEOP|nr:hypothetical protein PR048_005230 [Dryococelus australis]